MLAGPKHERDTQSTTYIIDNNIGLVVFVFILERRFGLILLTSHPSLPGRDIEQVHIVHSMRMRCGGVGL